MAAVLDMTRAAAEPSLIIKWGGEPSAWRWRGRLYEVAAVLARWADHAGREWYRVESEEGLTFLLGHDRDGWVASPWPTAPRGEAGRRAVN